MPITRQSTLRIEQSLNELENRAEQFVTAAVANTSAYAISKTPREYGNLANSQYTRVDKYPRLIYGRVGYASNYAAYLNGLPGYPVPRWNPRPVNAKAGPSTNMRAEPQFLNKAFEDPNQIGELQRLLLTFRI